MNKQTIERSFQHGAVGAGAGLAGLAGSPEPFQELEILRECTETRCLNILEHIETFEDAEHYFVVTKFMPAGDLLNYVMKQPV